MGRVSTYFAISLLLLLFLSLALTGHMPKLATPGSRAAKQEALGFQLQLAECHCLMLEAAQREALLLQSGDSVRYFEQLKADIRLGDSLCRVATRLKAPPQGHMLQQQAQRLFQLFRDDFCPAAIALGKTYFAARRAQDPRLTLRYGQELTRFHSTSVRRAERMEANFLEAKGEFAKLEGLEMAAE